MHFSIAVSSYLGTFSLLALFVLSQRRFQRTFSLSEIFLKVEWCQNCMLGSRWMAVVETAANGLRCGRWCMRTFLCSIFSPSVRLLKRIPSSLFGGRLMRLVSCFLSPRTCWGCGNSWVYGRDVFGGGWDEHSARLHPLCLPFLCGIHWEIVQPLADSLLASESWFHNASLREGKYLKMEN